MWSFREHENYKLLATGLITAPGNGAVSFSFVTFYWHPCKTKAPDTQHQSVSKQKRNLLQLVIVPSIVKNITGKLDSSEIKFIAQKIPPK